MRLLRLLLVVGLLLVAMAPSVSAQGNNARSATIQVDGLSCPFCAYGLEKHLKKVNGVEAVEINMKSGKATVNFKTGAQVDDAVLNEAVEKAGFTARSITRH